MIQKQLSFENWLEWINHVKNLRVTHQSAEKLLKPNGPNSSNQEVYSRWSLKKLTYFFFHSWASLEHKNPWQWTGIPALSD